MVVLLHPRRGALLFIFLFLVCWTARAFIQLPPAAPLHSPRRGTPPAQAFRRMEDDSPNVREYYAITEIVKDNGAYLMTATRFSTDEPNPQTWMVRRQYVEMDEFQRRLNAQLGYILPVFPPMAVLDASLLPLCDYLNKVLEMEQVTRRKELLDFLDVPKSIREREDTKVVTYKPEIIDEYGRVMGEQTPQEVSKGAAVAGAVTGFFLGGPIGALMGGVVGGIAANRGDLLGDAARAAGKATNIGINKVKEVDDRYRVTERVGDVVKEGVKKFKDAVDKLEE